MTYKRRPPIGPVPRGPAGPAGALGGSRSTREIIAAWYAAHDRPAPQMQSRTRRRAIPSQRAYPVARRTYQ